MNDLNMINAHNAELRSIGSPTGLFCDAPSSAPEMSLVAEFCRAMEHAGQHEAGSQKNTMADSDTCREAGPVGNPMPDGETMPFTSLFSMGAAIPSSPAAETGPVYPPLPPEALESLVDRILVSSAECGRTECGRAEVRLTVSDRVLSGTEIIIKRDMDGQLVVSLHCTNEASFQTLVASQTDLAARLEDFENRSVQVSVDIDRERGDADRRSRGYIEQDQQEAETSNA
ncbi:MAG: hypothetical protein IKY97_03770 [Mailhella sp.]|nr:hypothetical protein [Mailhella sp.]